jgi:hypothetical protein
VRITGVNVDLAVVVVVIIIAELVHLGVAEALAVADLALGWPEVVLHCSPAAGSDELRWAAMSRGEQ